MRWFMLPVSAAAHVAAFLVTLVVPLATGVEAPTPWPSTRTTDFIAVAPAPPPPILRTVSTVARSDAAPREAPDRIADPPLGESVPPGPVAAGIGDDVGVPAGVIGGVPDGIASRFSSTR